MLESIVVVFIVVVAGIFVLNRVYREATGKKSSCNCGEACPLNKSQGCALPEDIRDASAPNAPDGCPLEAAQRVGTTTDGGLHSRAAR